MIAIKRLREEIKILEYILEPLEQLYQTSVHRFEEAILNQDFIVADYWFADCSYYWETITDQRARLTDRRKKLLTLLMM